MDTRKLMYFVRIVDSGSITKAATNLHVAQPALSQQVASLEKEFKQRLLIRTKQGVAPTVAGQALYRHAQTILRLVDQARTDVEVSAEEPVGRVSIAIAPYSMVSRLVPDIVSEVADRYPGITLHLTESFGGVLSEAIRIGKLDMALIYEPHQVHGVQFTAVIEEDLHLVTNLDRKVTEGDTITLADVAELPLFLPEQIHTLRQLVDAGFAARNLEMKLVGEVESVPSLGRLIHADLGAAILPESAAAALYERENFRSQKIIEPNLPCKISLCTAVHEPLSEPAMAVLMVIREIIRRTPSEEKVPGYTTRDH